MKTKKKSVPDEIPNSAHIRLNDSVSVIIYLIERWVSRKSRFSLNSTHLKENRPDSEVDMTHQKRLDLF